MSGVSSDPASSWRRRCWLLAATVVVAAAIAAPRPAAAQSSVPGVDTSIEWISVAWDSVSGLAGSAWSRAASYVLPEAPLDWLPERMSDRDRAFVAAMHAAGYRLAAGETGGGFLPNVQYRFALDREPTPTDIERARALLENHRDRFWGIAAMGQRRILESLIDASGSSAMRVTAVEIGLRPLPWIRYELAAVDRPLEDSERRVIERLSQGRPR